MKTKKVTKDLRLEIKFWGSVIDSQVFIEKDNNIGFWIYSPAQKIHYKDLKNYPIEGDLDVKMFCKGKDGASATLTIKIKDQSDEILKCIIEDSKETSTVERVISIKKD